MYAHFSQFGSVLDFEFKFDEQGNFTGGGYVTFADPNVAQNVLQNHATSYFSKGDGRGTQVAAAYPQANAATALLQQLQLQALAQANPQLSAFGALGPFAAYSQPQAAALTVAL